LGLPYSETSSLGIKTLDRPQQWLSWEEIGLQEENAEIWECYTQKLRSCFINLNDEEDQLIWSLNPIGNYEPRLGYKALAIEGNENPQSWWSRLLYKFKCPSK
jgi:hypothetical protein